MVLKYAGDGRLIGRIAMRTIHTALTLIAVSASIMIDARPSNAEIYRPWCVQYSGRDGATTCTFSSYEQCRMTATPGSGGYCIQNPWYLQYGPGGEKSDTTGRAERTRR
jgi:uncharacterized protein DUF3551